MFLSVYGSYTGDFIVIFPYTYILYPSLVHPLPLLSLVSPLLVEMTWKGFNSPYSYIYRKYLSHIHLLLPFSFTLALSLYPPVNMTCFTFLSFIVLVSVHCLVEFCLDFLPINILYFSQSTPHYCS
jgi:hypothetical protein